METLKNIFTGFLVVAVVVIVVGGILQGIGFLYQYTFPVEWFSMTMAPEWGRGEKNPAAFILIGYVRFLWGIVTVVGLLLVAGVLWVFHEIGKGIS